MAHLGRVRETQNHKIILIKNYRKIALVAGCSKEKKSNAAENWAELYYRECVQEYWHFFYAPGEKISSLFSAL